MIVSNHSNTGGCPSLGVATQANKNNPKKVVLISNAVSPEK